MKNESIAGRSSGNDDALRAEEDVTTVQELIDKQIFDAVNLGDSLDRQTTVPFCCDLLSIVIGCAPAGCAWATVTANVDILAVSALTDTACVILAEGVVLDDTARKKAPDQETVVLPTDMSVSETALKIHGILS